MEVMFDCCVEPWKKVGSRVSVEAYNKYFALQNYRTPRGEVEWITYGERDWIIVLPLFEGGVVMVQEWKAGCGITTTCFPAGSVNCERPSQAAARELQEETSLCGRLHYLGSSLACSSSSPMKYHMFVAEDCVQTERHPDEHEYLRVVKVSLAEMWDMAASGDIQDGCSCDLILKAHLKGFI